MDTFQYVDNTGGTKTIQASSSQEALSIAPDRAPNSGVMMVNAQDIQNTRPLDIPAQSQSQAPSTMTQGIAEAQTLSTRQQAEAEAERLQKESDREREQLLARADEVTGIMQSRGRLEEESGLPTLRTETADITSRMEALDLSTRRQIERIEQQEGKTAAGIEAEVRRLERDTAREMADMSIVLNSKLRRQEALETSIDRRIKLDLEPLLFRLQFDQQFYQENREVMTKSQDRAFQLRIQEEERSYNEQLAEKQQIGQVAMIAAQYGASASQIQNIFKANSFDGALASGSKFLGAGFALQVQQFNFQKQMAIQSAEIQMAEQEQKILDGFLKSNQEANKAFMSSDEAQALTTVKGQVAQIDELFQNLIGTSDRTQMTQEKWDILVKDMSAVRAVANAEARALNPDLTRAMAGGDLNAATSLVEISEALFERYTKGRNVRIVDMQNAVRSIDSTYNARLKEAEKAISRYQTLYPNSQIINEYNSISPIPIRERLETAERTGYNPMQIVDFLRNDPVLSGSILQAESSGYTPLQIYDFLKKQ